MNAKRKVWKIDTKQERRAVSRQAPPAGPRFTHADHPGAVFVRMDRRTHFDGESRTAYVFGLRIGHAGGEWERFNEESVSYY